VGSDTALIGKQYPQVPWTPDSARLAQFAAATGGKHAAYTGAHAIVPPMAVVLASVPLGVAQVVSDRALIGAPTRLLHLLHSAEDITWRRPVQPHETLWVCSSLEGIDTTAAGETLRVVTDLLEGAGTQAQGWVVRARSALFIRERTRLAPRGRVPRAAQPAVLGPVIRQFAHSWDVAVDQAARYAAASGDVNPIHLDEATARQAGLKGPVVHGLCTMAFAQRAIVHGFADDTPARLQRLAVRFVRPVYPGDRLTLTADGHALGHVQFSVRNQDGRAVLEQGSAQLAPPQSAGQST
jgi:acyl dehydratase